MRRGIFRFCGLILAGILTACSGSDGDDNGGVTPQGGAVIGAAGGTVEGPAGVRIVIPAGALASDTAIQIEKNSDGAPALPGDFSPIGPMYAFLPHGLQFTVPVILTLPFDVAAVPSGTIPALYKTNAQQQWERLDGVTFNETTVSARITGFSNGQMGVELAECPKRYWTLSPTANGETLLGVRVWNHPIDPVLYGEQGCGEVQVPFLFGTADETFEQDNGATRGLAMGEVFSSPDGKTFWAYAEAPSGDPLLPNFRSGGKSKLYQYQSYVKRAPDAKLQLELSAGFLAIADFNGRPLPVECDNRPLETLSDEEIVKFCLPLRTEVEFLVTAYRKGKDISKGDFEKLRFFLTRGTAYMEGFHGKWKFEAYTDAESLTPLWMKDNFTVTGLDGSTPLAALNTPLFINVDLSSIEVCPPETLAIFCGDRAFTVGAVIKAEAWNHRGRESGAAAYLRDPQNISGTALHITGLEATNNPSPMPTESAVPVPCAAEPDPAAGTLQWSTANFSAVEGTARVAELYVTRMQGSNGAVSVNFSAGGGTAVSGVDYEAPDITVHFADGDTTPRLVSVKLLHDTLAEPDKTVNLVLSNPGGCASLGTPSTAVLTVRDDDSPPPVNPTYTVGGTVSGLTGSGLILEETRTGSQLTPGNGAFAFNYAFQNGSSYEVRVMTQPTNPAQICSLANPSGMIANANVTNVAVTCVTPAANGALDPDFGEGGKVSSSLVASIFGGDPARAVALQSDGKIVVLANMALVRFNTNGSLDQSFGSGGVLPVVFQGTSNNETSDLAIDANNRIIVVGWTRASNTTLNYDFAINRYDANGTLDSSFDSDGKLTIDFFGEVDRAHRVLLDSSGRILVAGQANARLPEPNPLNTSNTVFILTRLNSDGSRDNSLLARFVFDGGYSVARALALAPNGKIMLGGLTANSGTSESNTALARFGVDGELDSDQDSDSEVWFGVMHKGFGADDIVHGGYDYVSDLVITGDDRIWGTVFNYNLDMTNAHVGRTGKLNFLLAEFGHNFGDDGQAPDVPRFTEVPLGLGDDLATALTLQADGKLVLVGNATNTASGTDDFGIVRFDANGVLDTAFGSNGVVKIDFFGGIDTAKDIVVQPDGKLIVVGVVRNGSSWSLGLARVNP